MSNRIMRAAVCAALTGAALGVAAPALAELGGTPTPPPPGATARSLSPLLHAQSSAASTAAYSVTQTTLASGDIVREYVSTAGTVFGIAWSGPMMPDLPTLLGAYFTQYDSARRGRAAAPSTSNCRGSSCARAATWGRSRARLICRSRCRPA